MHEIYELKETLCRELEDYGKKGTLTTSELEYIDKLAHTVKNLDKIIEKHEEESGEYSNASYARGNRGNSYDGYGMSNRYYDDGMMSYARGDGRGRGRNAKRDSMGRYSSERGYSRDDEMISELRELMHEAPDERTRQEFKRFIEKIENM